MPFSQKIAALSLRFLSQASEYSPTDEEFVRWVDSQPLPVRPLLYLAGPEKSWRGNSASFQAWVLEARGISFADYLVKRLCERDYLRWVELYGSATFG